MESIRRVFLPSILVDVEFEGNFSRFNFGDKVTRFSIGVVRGVFQYVQNLVTGIANPTRSSRYGYVARNLSDE